MRCRHTTATTTAVMISGVNTMSAPAQNMLRDNASSWVTAVSPVQEAIEVLQIVPESNPGDRENDPQG
jgi:hypothetical protein